MPANGVDGSVTIEIKADKSQFDQTLAQIQRDAQNVQDINVNINTTRTQQNINDLTRETQNASTEMRNMSTSGQSAAGDLESAFDKVKSSVTGLIAALGAAKIVDILGDLTKQCVEAYAEYEQLVGGVDTIFKDSSEKVQEYAAEAYSKVGIDANQYMQQVTSFSASLLQSLGGDTEKAADLANQAMIDMADNANKMGTSMESIQNAYQGFAKQNFTMLDNLKLGYGGTKSEMERLIADVNKWREAQGEAGNLTVDSYADIITAIHEVQERLDIAGTTADEAAKTIQGSANAMKAAWNNLLVGFADSEQEVSKLIDIFTDSVTTFTRNVVPVLTQTLEALPEGLISIAEEILPVIPDLVQKLLPIAVSGIKDLASAVLDAVGDLGSQVIAYTPELLQKLVSVISDIGDSLLDALSKMGDSLSENAAEIIGNAFSIVVNTLVNEIPQLTERSAEIAQKILVSIYDGFTANLPALLSKIPDIVSALLETFKNLTVSFAEFSLLVFEKISSALIENLPTLLDTIPEIIQAVIDTFLELAPQLAQFSARAIKEIREGLTDNLPELLGKCGEVVGQLVRAFIEYAPQFVSVAVEIVETIGSELVNTDWTGVAEATIEGLWNALDKAWRGIKGLSGGSHSKESKERFRNFIGVDSAPEVVGEVTESIEDIRARHTAEAEQYKKASKEAANATKENAEEIKSLEEQLKELDHQYKIHELTEEEYWAKRKELVEANRDESSEEWWAYSDKITEYYDKKLKAEQTARDKALKQQQQQDREQIAALKDAKEKAYREINTSAYTQDFASDLEQTKYILDEQLKWLTENQSQLTQELYDKYYAEWQKAYDSYNKKVEAEQQKQQKKVEQEQKQLQSKFESATTSIYNNTRKTVQSEIKDVKASFDELVKEYDEGYNKIISQRDAYKKQLMGGSVFEVLQKTDEKTGQQYTEYTINNLKDRIKKQTELAKSMQVLKERGLAEGLTQELMDMDVEDAAVFAKQIAKMSDAEFNELNDAYKKLDEDTTKLANDYYKDSLEDLNKNFVEKSEALFGGVSENLKELGVDSAANYIDSMRLTFKDGSEEVVKDVTYWLDKVNQTIDDGTADITGILERNLVAEGIGDKMVDAIINEINANRTDLQEAVRDLLDIEDYVDLLYADIAAQSAKQSQAGYTSASIQASKQQTETQQTPTTQQAPQTVVIDNKQTKQQQEQKVTIEANLKLTDKAGQVIAEVVDAYNKRIQIGAGK